MKSIQQCTGRWRPLFARILVLTTWLIQPQWGDASTPKTQSTQSNKAKVNPKKVTTEKTLQTQTIIPRIVHKRTLHRTTIQNWLKHPALLVSHIGLVPHILKAHIKGLRIVSIRKNSVYTDLGFKKGDIIQTVNGFQLHSPKGALKAYSQLLYSRCLKVNIVRKGVRHQLLFTIKKALTKQKSTYKKRVPQFVLKVPEIVHKRTIGRSTVQHWLNNPKAYSMSFRIVPYYEGGRSKGLRLVWIRKNSLYSQLGFKAGDIIQTINGLQLNLTNTLKLYSQLPYSKQLKVNIIRKGVLQQLFFTIQ